MRNLNRRSALAVLGITAVTPLVIAAPVPEKKKSYEPPKITGEELAKLVKENDFTPNSLYGHEIEFDCVVKISRSVPLVSVKGMKAPYSQIHLYGGGGNPIEGKEMHVRGMIVDHGYGALMVCVKKEEYLEEQKSK